MTTFIIGLVLLIVGGAVYGKFVEHIFHPDDRQTPAVRKQDGVDFVPMSKFKNALINLLNIAGTGPIFGPIQGILFGPIAFITIPIGCVRTAHRCLVSFVNSWATKHSRYTTSSCAS